MVSSVSVPIKSSFLETAKTECVDRADAVAGLSAGGVKLVMAFMAELEIFLFLKTISLLSTKPSFTTSLSETTSEYASGSSISGLLTGVFGFLFFPKSPGSGGQDIIQSPKEIFDFRTILIQER